MSEPQRLDKWLWHARFFKSRSLAARQCGASKVRINRAIARKPSAVVRVGDVLTFPQGARIRVIKVAAMASRRGPASEAAQLYQDIAPPTAEGGPAEEPGARRGARPTKQDRRAIEQFRTWASGREGASGRKGASGGTGASGARGVSDPATDR